MMLCSAACSSNPPVISADTSCVRFRHIDVSEFEVDAMKKDPGTWRPLAVQILGHNQEYEKACVNNNSK
jgi:hypothetical protein